MTRMQVLRQAVRTAIANKCNRKTISVPHWARTYDVSQKAVRETWEMELTKLAPNSDSGVEGK